MNMPITAALASFGMSGIVFHGPLLAANTGFRLTKILERNRSDSREFYPETELVRSFDALCHDNTLELIVVNTPDNTHTDLVRQAILAGKHVVVEKPFVLRHADALELAELAAKKGVVLSVFQNRRWDGDFLTVQQVINQGILGRLVSFESHFDRFRNFIQEGTWKEAHTSGTGTLYNLGSHMIDQALVLFGMPESIFADVRAMRTGSQVDDSFDVWMGYPETKVLIRGSYLVKEPGPRYILHGTNGSFLKWGIDPQEEALKAGAVPGQHGWGEEPVHDWGIMNAIINGEEKREKVPTLPGNYNAYYDNVYDAIRHGKPLSVTAKQAADCIKIIEAAWVSARTKTVVTF